MREKRYGFYLRPSAAVSRAQGEIHELLKRQFGLEVAGKFMPHATIKGFYKSDASPEQMIEVLHPVIAKHKPFPVYNAGAFRWGAGTIVLEIGRMPDGSRNEALQAIHEDTLDVLLPLVAKDCNFTWTDAVRDRFRAHLTLNQSILPAFVAEEVFDFIEELGTVRPSLFTAEAFHLYSFESDDWYGNWWETMTWELLYAWRLGR